MPLGTPTKLTDDFLLNVELLVAGGDVKTLEQLAQVTNIPLSAMKSWRRRNLDMSPQYRCRCEKFRAITNPLMSLKSKKMLGLLSAEEALPDLNPVDPVPSPRGGYSGLVFAIQNGCPVGVYKAKAGVDTEELIWLCEHAVGLSYICRQQVTAWLEDLIPTNMNWKNWDPLKELNAAMDQGREV